MRAFKALMIVAAMILAMAQHSEASIIIAPVGVSATGSGPFGNSVGFLIDGFFPAEGSQWDASTNVFWSGPTKITAAQSFTIDYGAIYMLQDVLLSVDNNDDMQISYSTDGTNFTNLFKILVFHGEIGGGMDTMSTDATHGEYVSQIDFAAVQARYLRIQATDGDNFYSVGEIQAFGDPVATVPEPASLAIWSGIGLAGLVIGWRRKRMQAVAA